MSDVVRSGDAVFRCSDGVRVAEWNAAAERLTGISAADAVGCTCWEVIRGTDAAGNLICHPGCSVARLAKQGWPVTCKDLHVRTPTGPKRLEISTIVVEIGEGQVVLHPMRIAELEEAGAGDGGRAPRLTPRQLEILSLLAAGVRVKQIAFRLTLSETTVRNHIRAVLSELGAHSQLEAVAKARQLALVS